MPTAATRTDAHGAQPVTALQRLRSRACALALLAICAPAAPLHAQDAAEQFRAAWARTQAGEVQSAQADSDRLRSYVIYDYLVAARLRRALPQADEALDARIDAFVAAHAGQPVVRGLQRDWLLSLAARQRWAPFLARYEDGGDAELICDRLQARLALQQTAGLVDEALARWQLPQDAPRACTPVFDWLRAQGALTPERVEARTRAALAAGNAKLARALLTQLPADFPAARLAPLRQWANLLDSPATALPPLAQNAQAPIERAVLLQAWDRFALKNTQQAASLYPGLAARPDLDAEARAQLLRQLALAQALDRDPAALESYRALPLAALDKQAHEWRLRAALWSGDWAQLHAWIAQLPPDMAAQPRWRYWQARGVAATQGAEAAQPLYAAMAGERDLYSYLAADRVGSAYQLKARPTPDDTALQQSLAARPGLQRAQALFACGLVDEAGLEWTVATPDLDAAQQVQAARLASRWGWYAQAIATLAKAGEWDDVRLRYPRPYADAVTAGARASGLSPDWIWAVMRQESLFRADATSRANALGLLQLLLPTAREVARRNGEALPTREALFDPNVAVPLGALHLRELYDRYGDQLAPTLAAYNAGVGAVARWLPARPMDADVWIENIPYAETRSYVQRILEHIVAFGWTADGKPPRLSPLLPPLRAPGSASADAEPVSDARGMP